MIRASCLAAARDIGSPGGGQHRLDQITHHIANSMGTQVCSIYLFRDAETLELCATEGLKPGIRPQDPAASGRGAGGPRRPVRRHVNTANAPAEPGFRFMPETGEEVYPSFLGVPIQRVGEKLGVASGAVARCPPVQRGRGLRP